jgi:hypothetical protein
VQLCLGMGALEVGEDGCAETPFVGAEEPQDLSVILEMVAAFVLQKCDQVFEQ